MEVNAILCNYAEVQNNLLYISGGGIDRSFVPQGVPGPWGVSIALAVTLTVPWTQTNQQHALAFTLVDEDGHPVQLPTEDGQAAFQADMQFNLGRPPTLDTGEGQTVSMVLGLPSLPMPRLGRFSFVISVDGTELRRIPYRVTTQPGLTMQGGPAGLPRLPG